MSEDDFESLNLSAGLIGRIKTVGFKAPTEIQCLSIPSILKRDDLIASADTGSGKTAAFVLPILDILDGGLMAKRSSTSEPMVLVLAPTRELAEQIDQTVKSFSSDLSISSVALYGGVEYAKQISTLSAGVDIVVATPGRLIDLKSQGVVSLTSVEIVVLDEADRMLEMGFREDIELLLEDVSKTRQTLLFSATIPLAVEKLSAKFQNESVVRIEALNRESMSSLQRIDQWVYFVDHAKKMKLLHHLLSNNNWPRVIIFTRTRTGCFKLNEALVGFGYSTEFIHGQRSQEARTKSIEDLKEGKIRILVATDVAARGIDVPDITCVVNFDLPNEPEVYIHRVGRTGRAGNVGRSLSFCAGGERSYLAEIERIAGIEIPAVLDHPYPARPTPLKKKKIKNRSTEASWKSAARRHEKGKSTRRPQKKQR